MENYCANCLFSQSVDSKTVCRNKKIGPHIARKYYRWYLSDEEKKSFCPEFFKARPVPGESPIRGLLGPGAARLKKIAQQAEADRDQHKKAGSLAQSSLDI